MAARLTDKQKKKIIADYLETQSINATAKKNNVSWGTVRSVLDGMGDIEEKLEQKKDDNTADILAYMESQKGIVCEILGKGLEALNDPEKLAEATPAQITTAMGTLIDKWTMISSSPDDTAKEDDLSRSLRELGKELESDGT